MLGLRRLDSPAQAGEVRQSSAASSTLRNHKLTIKKYSDYSVHRALPALLDRSKQCLASTTASHSAAAETQPKLSTSQVAQPLPSKVRAGSGVSKVSILKRKTGLELRRMHARDSTERSQFRTGKGAVNWLSRHERHIACAKSLLVTGWAQGCSRSCLDLNNCVHE